MEMLNNIPEQISLKNKYLSRVDNEGYVSVSAFATTEIKRQTKSVAGLIDGEEGSEPDYFLGECLRYKGSSGNYSNMKIHVDDLEEFINRVKKHYGE